MAIMFMKVKSHAFYMIKWYKARVEKETRKYLKCFIFNRGGEFISDEFNIFGNEKGIKRKMSVPRTPLQNGIAKRRNRSIIDCARMLMLEKDVS